jgi:NIMA (never in mitosis gene a)-related kinase
MKEELAWKLISQMIMGVKVLHDNHILHRDIKCANIFLNSR